MSLRHAPVHYATAGQMLGLVALCVVLIVIFMGIAWKWDRDEFRRDDEAIEERRRMNEAFSKDRS